MFIVLTYSHCESSPGSSDECRSARLAAANPPTKPTDLGVESACIGCYVTYIHHRHLLLLSPKADTHFTVPQRVEG